MTRQNNLWSDNILKAQTHFVAEGYTVFHDALSNTKCADYATRIIDAEKKGKCVKDQQCPTSSAHYGLFDDLLVSLKPIMEGVSGKVLYPTYSYARIYKPGEVLEKHTDRPSCEISCTMTLAYKGDDLWPIFFKKRNGKDSEVIIPVGSFAAYMGMELQHWRKKYKQGKQQIQVFLHYVDALGKYSDHAFDKRRGLNV